MLKPNLIDHQRRVTFNYYNKVKRKLGFATPSPGPRKIRVGFALNTMDLIKALKMSLVKKFPTLMSRHILVAGH
jgi:hypothetical protein